MQPTRPSTSSSADPVRVNCRDWCRHATRRNAGLCVAGVYPTPSVGVCRLCDRRRPVDPAAPAVTGEPEPAATWPPATLAAFRRLWDLIYAEPNPSLAWWGVHVMAALPCGECREHAVAYADANPPPWGDPAQFRPWARGLENDVRRRQGRSERVIATDA